MGPCPMAIQLPAQFRAVAQLTIVCVIHHKLQSCLVVSVSIAYRFFLYVGDVSTYNSITPWHMSQMLIGTVVKFTAGMFIA